MRKFYYLLLLLLFAGRAEATIALVQTAHGSVNNGPTGGSVSATFAGTTAGNFILVYCGASTGSINPITPAITDVTNGTRLTSIRTQDGGASTGWGQNVSYEANIPGGALTLTCRNQPALWYIIIAAEYSGVDTRFPVDTAAVNGTSLPSGSGTSHNSGSITTTQAHEVLVSFFYDDTHDRTMTVDTGFAIEDQLVSSTSPTGVTGGFADKLVSTIQTGTSVNWINGALNGDTSVITIIGIREAFSTASPVALVQKAGATTNTTASISKAFPSNNTAGNMIVVACDVTNNQSTITPSDSNTNTYHLIDSLTTGVTTRVSWWYALSIAAGANTVTCTYSGNDSGLISILEYSGINAIDQHSAQFVNFNGVAPPASGLPITTTSAKELVIAFADNNEPTYVNAGPGNFSYEFMQATGSGSDYFYIYDQYVTSIASFTNYWVLRNNANEFIFTASFIQSPPSPRRKSTIL